jgi:hypothetical protein
LISNDVAQEMFLKNPKLREVCFPYLIGEEMIGNKESKTSRYVIDFRKHDIFSAMQYDEVFKIVKDSVYPDKELKAKNEEEKNNKTRESDPQAKVNHHHQNFFNQWWKLSYDRSELMKKIEKLSRYIVCSRVTKRPIFEFVSSDIHPSGGIQ